MSADWKKVFGARLAEAIRAHGTVPQFAKRVGIADRTLRNWIGGVSFPPTDQLFRIAREAGVDYAWLLDLEDEPARGRPARLVSEGPPAPGVASIALVDARAAAGAGAWNLRTVEIARIPFPEDWLRKLGGRNSERCDFLRVTGDSMEPTIAPGALLLIDRDQADPPKARRGKRKAGPVPDDIFVFIFDGDLRVKRLASVEPGRLAIISDNAAIYPIEILSKDESARVKILGRVIWWDNRL